MEIQPFNQKQRDVFARMLVQAKERAQAELESDSDLNHRVENEVIPKLAEEKGATELVAKVRKLRKEVEEVEGSLERLGFDCSDERITLKWDAPKALSQVLESAKRSARKENQLSLKKFDLAHSWRLGSGNCRRCPEDRGRTSITNLSIQPFVPRRQRHSP